MTDSAQKSGKQQPRGKPFTGSDDPRRNAGGRPPGYAAYREKMRGHSDAAIAALASDLEVPEKRAFAAKTILEFGWGKAPSAPEDNDAVSRGLGMTREDVLLALLGRHPAPKDEDDALALPVDP